MINLIPNKERREIKREFYARFSIVFVFSLGICFLIGTLLLVPSFYLTFVENKDLNLSLNNDQLSSDIPQNQNSFFIEDLSTKVKKINSIEQSKFSISDNFLDKILLLKTDGIKFFRISYEKEEKENTGVITLSGVAKNRENLLFLKNNLEKESGFKNVNLPISNFAKSDDIEFSIKIDYDFSS